MSTYGFKKPKDFDGKMTLVLVTEVLNVRRSRDDSRIHFLEKSHSVLGGGLISHHEVDSVQNHWTGGTVHSKRATVLVKSCRDREEELLVLRLPAPIWSLPHGRHHTVAGFIEVDEVDAVI